LKEDQQNNEYADRIEKDGGVSEGNLVGLLHRNQQVRRYGATRLIMERSHNAGLRRQNRIATMPPC
jgi:hypothetical protein